MLELDPVTRLTADAVGSPGNRTFFLQAASGVDQVTLLVEKEQVRLLAERLTAWLPELAELKPEDPAEAAEAASSTLDLQEPLIPAFRVGQLSLSYDPERDRILVVAEEVLAGEDDEDEGSEGSEASEGGAAEPAVEDPRQVRLVVTRPQLRVLAEHGAEVVGKGRPECPLCGNPIDPEGHTCPAQNGHRPFSPRS
jgi:uncharacterized repeat protein (TIGR03847 family)